MITLIGIAYRGDQAVNDSSLEMICDWCRFKVRKIGYMGVEPVALGHVAHHGLEREGSHAKENALRSRSLPVRTNVSVDQYLKSKSTLHSKADPTTLQSE